jgi:Na+-driven multidrug efflux pump
MLFGVGAANMISMRLGEGKREDAENALNHCFWLSLIFGIVLMVVQLIFLDFFVSLLGAQEGSGTLEYAKDYYRVILYGNVFAMVGFGFSHCTRAQGFPMITMIGMFIGAGTNFILDPLFIYFGWGVEGVAFATIISQLLSAIYIMIFSFGKKAVIRLSLKTFKPSLRIIGHIIMFGSAQFIMQFIMSGVQLLNNTMVGWYGADALGVSNGGDIALSGLNIAGSIMMMIMMPVFGINQGAQPILGYNYGAKKFSRVLNAYLKAVGAATVICILGFIVGEVFPHFLTGIFINSEGSEAILTFTPLAIRIQLLMFPFAGFQIVSSNMFVVTGRAKTSIFLSMLRQFIALIPCMLIFGRIWGLYGVVASQPVADVFALIVTGILIYFELKRLRTGAKLEAVTA